MAKTKNQYLEAPDKIKILVTIVDREKTQFYLDILEGFEVNLQTVLYGSGTAPSNKDVYGTKSNKSIIISAVKENRIKEILNNYEDKFFKTKKGKGVAFTIPISSVIGVSLYNFLSNNTEERPF